jgi:hypothetical protein
MLQSDWRKPARPTALPNAMFLGLMYARTVFCGSLHVQDPHSRSQRPPTESTFTVWQISHSGRAEKSSKGAANCRLACRWQYHPRTPLWMPNSHVGARTNGCDDRDQYDSVYKKCPNRILHMHTHLVTCGSMNVLGVLPLKKLWLLKSSGLRADVNIDDKAPCMQDP